MENKLTRLQAYKVMYNFLDEYYFKTKSDDIGALLSGLSLLQDDEPVETVFWDIWARPICNKDPEELLTPLQALELAIHLLDDHDMRSAFDDTLITSNILKQTLANPAPSSSLWNDWLRHVETILQDTENKYGYLQILSKDDHH